MATQGPGGFGDGADAAWLTGGQAWRHSVASELLAPSPEPRHCALVPCARAHTDDPGTRDDMKGTCSALTGPSPGLAGGS